MRRTHTFEPKVALEWRRDYIHTDIGRNKEQRDEADNRNSALWPFCHSRSKPNKTAAIPR